MSGGGICFEMGGFCHVLFNGSFLFQSLYQGHMAFNKCVSLFVLYFYVSFCEYQPVYTEATATKQ